MRIPVHVIAGFLGTGKTSAVLGLLEALKGEKLAVIVNDFGEGQIDSSVIDGAGVAVREIQGACVCCTAPSQFNAALGKILDHERPDRILVEPTGLARPADLVDTLRRGPHRDRVEVRPVIVLVDPKRCDEPLVHEQMEAADVLVANRCDLATKTELQAFDERISRLWPGPEKVVRTTYGRLSLDVLQGGAKERSHDHAHHASTDGFHVVSRIFDAETLFSWEALEALPAVERCKGIFRTDRGTFLIEKVGQRLHARLTPHRRDSRVDVIDRDMDRIQSTLQAIEGARRTLAANAPLELVLANGTRRTFSREELIDLPGGIPDVGVEVSGRSGAAVPVASVLEAVGASLNGEAVVTAGDGFASPAVALDVLARGWLVHSLGGQPLPADAGGPLRLLIGGNAVSACSNVKNVVQLVLL